LKLQLIERGQIQVRDRSTQEIAVKLPDDSIIRTKNATWRESCELKLQCIERWRDEVWDRPTQEIEIKLPDDPINRLFEFEWRMQRGVRIVRT
jgi:hypothetical protein